MFPLSSVDDVYDVKLRVKTPRRPASRPRRRSAGLVGCMSMTAIVSAGRVVDIQGGLKVT
jgi:hypothetical protein